MPIWPFRSRQPKPKDEALADLAEMFLSNPDDPTPGSESLDPTPCDYSVESIRAVDDHLQGMRARRPEGEALMKLEETIRDIGRRFGLAPEDLNLDLGPLGKLM